MKQARRLARWLRLVVTCLAFVIGSPSPAIAVDPLDTIVMVASDDARDDTREEVTAGEQGDSVEPKLDLASSGEAPCIVSRIYLANCALLL